MAAKVVDVHARFAARNLAVCKAGDCVALHFFTSRGFVVVSVGLKEFTAAARGPLDHNHNPLPWADPAAPFRPAPPQLIRQDYSRSKKGELAPRFAAAWAGLKCRAYETLGDAAKVNGLLPQTLSNWLAHHHRDEWIAIKRQMRAAGKTVRLPLQKPNGKLL